MQTVVRERRQIVQDIACTINVVSVANKKKKALIIVTPITVMPVIAKQTDTRTAGIVLHISAITPVVRTRNKIVLRTSQIIALTMIVNFV